MSPKNSSGEKQIRFLQKTEIVQYLSITHDRLMFPSIRALTMSHVLHDYRQPQITICLISGCVMIITNDIDYNVDFKNRYLIKNFHRCTFKSQTTYHQILSFHEVLLINNW